MFAALDTLPDLAKTDEGCEKFIAQYAFHGIPESALIDELSSMEDQDSIHRFGLRLWGHKWWCDKFAKVQFVRASSGIDPQQSIDDIIALHLPDTITVVVKQIRLLLDNFPSDKSPSGSNHPHQQSWAAKMQLALSTLAEVNGDDGRIRTAISKVQAPTSSLALSNLAHTA
jgi:hypothetical protein